VDQQAELVGGGFAAALFDLFKAVGLKEKLACSDST
jgi:hypothetical protein